MLVLSTPASLSSLTTALPLFSRLPWPLVSILIVVPKCFLTHRVTSKSHFVPFYCFFLFLIPREGSSLLYI